MSDYPMLISNKLHSFRNFMLQNYEIMDILPHKSAHKLAFNISFCHKTHIYALFMQHW